MTAEALLATLPESRTAEPGLDRVLLLQESRRRFTTLVLAYQRLWRGHPLERLEILAQLREEFGVHCRVEWESQGPRGSEAEDPSVSRRIGEAELEHRVIESLFQELSRSAPTTSWFEMLMKTLAIRFQRHSDQLDVHLVPLVGAS